MMTEIAVLDEDRASAETLGGFPRVLALDPGKTTGWAVVWFDDDALFDTQQSIQRAPVAWIAGMWLGPEVGHMDALMRMLRKSPIGGDGLAIVCEDFIPRAAFQDRDFLSPVRLTAMFRAGLHMGSFEADGVARRRTINPENIQSASDAKRVITDQRLDTWQMYLPGKDHPRDATRHALLWIRKLRGRGSEFYNKHHFIDNEEEEA